MKIKYLAVACLLLVAFTTSPHSFANPIDIEQSLTQANQFWHEKSFRQAAEHYAKFLTQTDLNKEEQREVAFKWADASWRTQENRRYEEAVDALKTLIESDTDDRWRAEANESLAEHYLQVDRWTHQEDIKQYFQNAREYWASSKNIELARKRFIKVSFTFGEYLRNNWGWHYNQIQPVSAFRKTLETIPDTPQSGLHVLYEEILQVATSDEDKAKAYYALAMSYMNQYYGQYKEDLAEKYFQKVIDEFSKSEWLDDAYYYLGQYHQKNQDYVKALNPYQGLIQRFKPGESQWLDNARNQIKNITSPTINLSNGYTYLPGSEILFSLNWHNVSKATFTIYKMDIVKELALDLNKPADNRERGVDNYQDILKQIVDYRRYQSFPKVLSWQKPLKNEGKHKQHNATQSLADWQADEGEKDIDPKSGILEPGAYLLLVNAAGQTAYDLILVTETALISKTGGHSALFFTMDSKTGKPKPEATIKYHYRYYDSNRNDWLWEEDQGVTDSKGLLKISLKKNNPHHYDNQHQIFATASDGVMQAFTQNNYYNYSNQSNQWHLYAHTDRPAYRPNEKVSFKATLRGYDDEAFNTPSGKKVKGWIQDARGQKVFEKTFILNDFGSLYDSFTLDEKATLGEYILYIYSEEDNAYLAQSTLFRLEEYKLPEFLVNINPKAKEGQEAAAYQLGDTVKIEVAAEYYFGGPVAEAEVEYLVYQNPYYHYYRQPREYGWYYDDMYPNPHNYYNQGQLLHKEKIKTDTHGKAIFEFQTLKKSDYDLSYRIEVRVVDQSRREITANREMKVTRQAFYAYLTPKNNLYRPGDKAEIDIKTITANNDPVSVDGKVTVSRNWWKNPIIKKSTVIEQGRYDATELFSKFVKTNKKGETIFSFEPGQDGYYIIAFTGFDNKGKEVKTQTNIFVCDKGSRDLGYRHGGIQIIAEKDTYTIGETARVMLTADKPDTWVLFSVEADEIFDYNLYHLDGAVKLLEFPVQESFTPNIFLNAISGQDHQLKNHTLALVVPPEEKFLNIKIQSDKEVYRPQEEGHFDVEVTDSQGHPVSGEMALGIVDASVYYIQQDYAGDIRQFFYGTKRPHSVQTNASFYQRSYVKLVRGDQNQIIDERITRQAGLTEAKIFSDSSDTFGGGRLEQDKFALRSMNAIAPMGEMIDALEKKEGRGFAKSSLASPAKKMKSRKNLPASQASPAPTKAGLAQPAVRQDFRSTVFWQPTIITDEDGKASVTVKFPDSLTTWRTTARSLTRETAVGTVTHENKTSKDILVRLQAPRFFTERDEVTISANVHNYTDTEQKIKVNLKAEGLDVLGEKSLWVTVEANGEQRVDWATVAQQQGQASLTVMAQAQDDADAVLRTYPIIPHGIEKFIAQSIVLKSKEGEAVKNQFTLDLPKKRIKESTSLQLTFSPSLAAALLDALPYLADYPYGCVEQTMSRFLPAVTVKKTMKDLGLTDTEIATYLNDVLEPRQDPEHPKRRKDATLSKLNQMTKASLDRLYDFQHSDGGWGWWKEGSSDWFMSAYVVWGLSLAKEAGIKVKGKVLNRAVDFLQKQLVEEENQPDMLAWMLHALSVAKSKSTFENKQSQRLWEQREKLNPYTRALFALSEHYRGSTEHAVILARNLANGLHEDKDNGTAHWGEAGIHYRFSEGGVEATAFGIKALANILPDSEYLEPAVKWLALNRRGGHWKNTRDTAIAILGLSDYLKISKELVPNFDYTVTVNGKIAQKGHVDRSNIFQFNRIITLPNDALKDGTNTVDVNINGTGALYVAGYLKYFTLEENITPAGNEVFVERKYFINDTAETLLKGYTTDWRPLKAGDTVKSGDRIKVEITLEAKNHYEYLIVEDYKPAGLEAVELKSGTGYAQQLDHKGKETGRTTWLYQEYRDQKAAIFIDKLKQGKHRIEYELRAEIPGRFHGMPNQVHAMYVPEIRANSSEMILTVGE